MIKFLNYVSRYVGRQGVEFSFEYEEKGTTNSNFSTKDSNGRVGQKLNKNRLKKEQSLIILSRVQTEKD